MDPMFKFPASPGTPLFPVSPERANRQQLPQSPSLPSIAHAHNDPFMTHSRGTSDVQGKVAQFNSLSKEAAQRRKDNEAALKRAVLGREEAESESRRLREKNQKLRLEVEEGRGRERRVSERMEGVMEQLQTVNETHAHSQAIYEKEVRRARKEAFKSSSALVKMQEELKSARNRYTLMREEVDVQRRKLDAKEQEIFAAQNMLVDFQEEIERLRQQNKLAEGQKEALKIALKGEEVARIAAEGAIRLPPSPQEAEIAPPKEEISHQHRDSLKENMDPEALEIEDELLILKEELRIEKRMRRRADDQIHFMKMECQFGCCSCRVAEQRGSKYLHDDTFSGQLDAVAGQKLEDNLPSKHQVPDSEQEEARPLTPPEQGPSEQRELSEPLVEFSPTTGTFHKTHSPQRQASPEPLPPISRPTTPPSEPAPQTTAIPTSPEQQTPPLTFPATPRPLPIPPARTISHTTTVTIPLKDDIPFSPAPMTPGGISKEEALEQIRLRRGRARSIAAGNGTPRKRIVEVGELRRDISAPGRV
ncbi:hypothetical protein ACLMJK_002311 [Lecanora helva]